MNKIKKIVMMMTFSLTLGFSYQSASAYTGYAGADTRLAWASQQASDAKSHLDHAGYATTIYKGSSFTQSSIQTVVPTVRVFYASCHGSSTTPRSIVTNVGTEWVYSSEMYSWTRGFYKFAFIDSCYSGDTKDFYSSFNMVDGDGKYNAFLGWKGESYDTSGYATFTHAVFESLDGGMTVNDAVWTARSRTGITNYQIYGNYSSTLYN